MCSTSSKGVHGFDREPFFKMFSDNPDIAFAHAEQAKTNATVYERDDLLSYDVLVLYDMPRNITGEPRQSIRWTAKR